jgi:hypothetical protein
MADLSGAVDLGGGVPILGQPAAPPFEEPRPIIAIDVQYGGTTIVIDGVAHPALGIAFEVYGIGWMPPIVLAIPDDVLLALPDSIRKAVREARAAAQDANASGQADADEEPTP